MSFYFCGIRHHGPGSAKSLISFLQTVQPKKILLEGPPEANEILYFSGQKEMIPPVAILLYDIKDNVKSIFYPYTNFSPEWQALQYAFQNKIPVEMIDMPFSIRLQMEQNTKTEPENIVSDTISTNSLEECSVNSLDRLAQISGYSNSEEWWENMVERGTNPIFQAIEDMMREVRSHNPPNGKFETSNEQREAFMRDGIRRSKEYDRVVVVCGAWHVSELQKYALVEQEKLDTAWIKQQKSLGKIAATWVPWSNSRLSYRSGYGAGIQSPEWYRNLWEYGEKAPMYWIIQAARILRKQDLDASSASVIETVRLAEALASMRNLRYPGLKELMQSVQTVLCHGEVAPMHMIRRFLEIGESIGIVPKDVPSIPLQNDLAKWQTGKLEATGEVREIELDLRQSIGLEQSLVLHRLNILGIPWGQYFRARQKGTSRENWRIKWDVTFVIQLIEKSIWGNTIEEASMNYLCDLAENTTNLNELAEQLDLSLLAQLPKASAALLSNIQKKSAMCSEVLMLVKCLPKLTELARYGDVRHYNQTLILQLIRGIVERILINIPNACMSIDQDVASEILEGMIHIQNSLQILNIDDMLQEWYIVLKKMVENESIHFLLRGWITRILFEKKIFTEIEFHNAMRQSLSLIYPPEKNGAWIIGMLQGEITWLIHQEKLWDIMDEWVTQLSSETFVKLLPILRRAFSSFSFPERRNIGNVVKNIRKNLQSQTTSHTANSSENICEARANLTLPILRSLICRGEKNHGM